MSQGKGFAMEIRSCAAEGGVGESEDQRDATNRPREALVQWSIQNRIGRQGRSIQMLSRTPKESRWRPQKCVASTPASGERVAVGQQERAACRLGMQRADGVSRQPVSPAVSHHRGVVQNGMAPPSLQPSASPAALFHLTSPGLCEHWYSGNVYSLAKLTQYMWIG